MLVDTSVWVDHFRRGESGLVLALENGEVQLHPFIIGELACGSLRNRREGLREAQQLAALDTRQASARGGA